MSADLTQQDARLANGNLHSFGRPVQVLAALAGFIELAVIFGWFTHNTFLIQLRADLVPHSFNSALLGFLACITLILLTRRRIALPRLIAGVALLAAAVTMAEYFTGTVTGLDSLFMEPYINVQQTYPGRMAISTAFSYLILNSGFLLFTLVSSRHLRSAATVCAAIVIATVIATVIGYEADLQPLFGWSAATYMALHSALAIFLLGLGLFVVSTATASDSD